MEKKCMMIIDHCEICPYYLATPTCPRWAPEEFTDDLRNWDASSWNDPAFWQKMPEKQIENGDEKPF